MSIQESCRIIVIYCSKNSTFYFIQTSALVDFLQPTLVRCPFSRSIVMFVRYFERLAKNAHCVIECQSFYSTTFAVGTWAYQHPIREIRFHFDFATTSLNSLVNYSLLWGVKQHFDTSTQNSLVGELNREMELARIH